MFIHGLVQLILQAVRNAILAVALTVSSDTWSRAPQVPRRVIVLVSHVTALVMLIVVMACLAVVCMMAVLLVFWHLDTISLMVLSPIHHDVLSLLSIVIVHGQAIVRRRRMDWRSRRRRRIVSEWSSAAARRRSAIDVSVVLGVLRIIKLARPRLLEPVRTICHLGWP